MKHRLSNEAKVGVFVAIVLAIIVYITLRVSDLSLVAGGHYEIYAVMDNVEGVTMKTPVQMAGIPIGVVSDINLTPDRKAKLTLRIKRSVTLPAGVEAQIRTRGVLGDTYIEMIPSQTVSGGQIKPGEELENVRRRADYQDLFGEVSDITSNVREITASLKEYTAVEKSHVAHILLNMDTLTQNMAQFSTNNMANMDVIVANLRALTTDLKNLSGGSSQDIQDAIHRISLLTDKIEKGEGTLGQLVTDDSTIKKTNKVLDNINDLTTGFSRMETELGWHLEYLGATQEVKNYVSLTLQPRPDKYFLFEIVHDPNPPTSTSTEITTVTANGVTSSITTETEKFDEVRFSAQLAKKFKDWTLRGGLIESSGGFGVDYNKGPFSVQFSAFEFGNGRPHLKLLGSMNLFPSIYMLTGVDDFISDEHGLNWFVGAGVRLTDRDIKSLVGGASLAR